MSTRDFFISAALISAGIATMVVIISPIVGPPTLVGRVVADRWPDPPQVAPKGDRQVISLLDPALIGPAEGDPVPASITLPEQKIIINSAQPRPREPSETCSRHGMRRQYFYRHHHLIWRCRRR